MAYNSIRKHILNRNYLSPLFTIWSTLIANCLRFHRTIWLFITTCRHWSSANRGIFICPVFLTTPGFAFRFKPRSELCLHVNFNGRHLLLLSWRYVVRDVAGSSSQLNCINRFLILSWILQLKNPRYHISTNYELLTEKPYNANALVKRYESLMLFNQLTRQATIKARLLPPRESCNIRVSLLSL